MAEGRLGKIRLAGIRLGKGRLRIHRLLLRGTCRGLRPVAGLSHGLNSSVMA